MNERTICPHCGAVILKKNFCTQCGGKISKKELEEYTIAPVPETSDEDSIEAIPKYSIKGYNTDFVSLYLRIQTIKIKTLRR